MLVLRKIEVLRACPECKSKELTLALHSGWYHCNDCSYSFKKETVTHGKKPTIDISHQAARAWQRSRAKGMARAK